MRKVCAVALPVVCFVLASCSMLKGPELLDVTGCGEIKWGMTLAQANSLLGSRAKLTTDPKNGNYLEVKMMVGCRTQWLRWDEIRPNQRRACGVPSRTSLAGR